MATDRKKRKINVIKSKLPKPKKVKPEKQQKAETNTLKNEPTSRLELINGTRKRRKIVRIVSFSVIALVVIALIVVNALSPTGIIEMTQNAYAALGSGEFPVNIYSKNATDCNSYNGVNLIVNDSYLEIYNQKGKLIQAASHGMSNPRLEASQARFLLFDRGRYGIKIFNYSNELYNHSFEQVIYSADIGRSGTYAVVAGSDTYLNTVYVFNKNNESVFTWNSANYYVSDVAVADNGKKIAVCLVNASGGSFASAVYILEYGSASPIHKYEFPNLVSSISSSGDYIVANGIDYAAVLYWNGYEKTVITDSESIRYFNVNSDGEALVVYGRENNQQINTVCLINKEGYITNTFNFNLHVDGVDFNAEIVTILSDEMLYVYNKNFEQINATTLDIKPLFVCVTDNNGVIAVDNSTLRRIEIT